MWWLQLHPVAFSPAMGFVAHWEVSFGFFISEIQHHSQGDEHCDCYQQQGR